jgi:hypothetical protein
VLRDTVERDSDMFDAIRRRLDPVEAQLWAEADAVAPRPEKWAAATARWSRQVTEVVAQLAADCG